MVFVFAEEALDEYLVERDDDVYIILRGAVPEFGFYFFAYNVEVLFEGGFHAVAAYLEHAVPAAFVGHVGQVDGLEIGEEARLGIVYGIAGLCGYGYKLQGIVGGGSFAIGLALAYLVALAGSGCGGYMGIGTGAGQGAGLYIAAANAILIAQGIEQVVADGLAGFDLGDGRARFVIEGAEQLGIGAEVVCGLYPFPHFEEALLFVVEYLVCLHGGNNYVKMVRKCLFLSNNI